MAMTALCSCGGQWILPDPGGHHQSPCVYALPMPEIRHCQTCTCAEAAPKQTERPSPFQDQTNATR